jgi:E3 ubiquitin-protein ligase DMA1/2
MTTTSVSTSAAAANLQRTNTPSPTPRRRGFGALRRLGPPSPGENSRLSPRSYFFRSVTYPQIPSNPQSNPAEGTPALHEPQSPTTNDSGNLEIASRATGTSLATGLPTSPAHDSGAGLSDMARHRPSGSLRGAVSESLHSAEARRLTRVGEDASADAGNQPNAQTNAQTDGTAQEFADEKSRPPTIRFFPHQELRQARQSLTFAPVVRTLPNETAIIRVGRYSEREGIPVSNPPGPSDAPVGFKSKVVSRKHCEFSFVNGSWQIKDVSSSSGTFLNHIRLSQPNTESRLYPVKDGDIVQLGIDFRGGEEMIFRCVKIRIECNRSWQKRPNNFKYVKFHFLF